LDTAIVHITDASFVTSSIRARQVFLLWGRGAGENSHRKALLENF